MAFLSKIATRVRRVLSPSAHRLEFAPNGWSTELPNGAASQDYWIHFMARERAACEALIARVRAGESILSADADERVKRVTFGQVIEITGRGKPRLSVLDVGGNFGDYYWIGKALVPGIELEFHCRELPAIAEAGRQINPVVSFHTGDECFERPHDLVMFSSSLQYLPHWQDVLGRAARAARGFLFLSDVPAVQFVPSYIAAEHADGAATLQHMINRTEIIDAATRAGFHLVREFDMGPHPQVANAPEQPVCVGWLFQR